jgi:hypothetical protein
MTSDRKFTNHDLLLGACAEMEVGTPWEDRWTKSDHWHGRCKEDLVGHSKEETGVSPEQPAADPDVAALQMEGIEGYEREAAAYHADSRGYIARTAPGVVKAVLDWIEGQKRERAGQATSLLDKAMADIVEQDSDFVLIRAIMAALADDDATRAEKIREALAIPDWQLRDMIAIVADTLPDAMRLDIAKHLMHAPATR